MKLGPLHIEFGGLKHKVGPVRLPDGLHIWIGNRGMHAYWKASPHMRRIIFDRLSSSKGERNG